MMKFPKTVVLLSLGISLFSMNEAFAASSDGYAWSVPAQSVDGSSVKVDQNGALTDVAQGNVGPAQSGPGASGLFTPNSPGNSAALSAQMHGGLEGSPIVDGVAGNLRVTVPLARPSLKPSYEQVTSADVTGVTHNTVLNDPPAAHTIQPQNVSSVRRFSDARELSPVENSFPSARTSIIAKPSRKAASLGRVNGSIDYGDGSKVLFGSGGAESITKTKNAVIQLNDGRTITKKTRI